MNKQQLKKQFSLPLLAWFDKQGRKDLPWQEPRDPYRVWVSEIMLQQTQVQTVIPYFNRFIHHFPSLQDLAQASEDQVLALWSGLGYYSRARNLLQTAQRIQKEHQGIFPQKLEVLEGLPGIGPSTAGAILSQAFNQPTAILDGNVKRVLSRFFLVSGYPEQAQVKNHLWALAKCCMPQDRCADYTQAIMDLGALCCLIKNPHCSVCPLKTHCLAFKQQQQAFYPSKKIKKPLPLKQEQMLLLVNTAGCIYLEKRPSKGVWAHLWCLPSLDFEQCPLHFIQEHYALQGETPIPLLCLKHRFTHFQLDIKAFSILVHSFNLQTKKPKGTWFKKEQLKLLGLAKPTNLILTKFLAQ